MAKVGDFGMARDIAVDGVYTKTSSVSRDEPYIDSYNFFFKLRIQCFLFIILQSSIVYVAMSDLQMSVHIIR